ncbi:MAG: hypothetical protein FWF44_06090, partial [Defluviitaleaceae bacterium]|nr:hypothetical protein [Defluviitaleaceae bacterium]
MKTWSRILCAAAMAFVVAAGIPCWVQADGSTARTIQLDGMSYTETVGADGSIIETPDGLKGTFPQYDPATGWLTVRALVVIFDKNQSTRPDVEPFQIGLQAFQDCFYDHSGEMKKWYPNQSNLSPGYDRLYPQKIHQIVTWKYYPNLMPITADQYEDAAYMRDWMNTYVEPGYQMIYLSDNIRIESNNVSNKSGSTWWQKSAAPGFDQYATNAIFLGFDMMGQTGDHGLGHAIEEIMDKLAPFIWSDDYDSLNEWSKFCCSKVTTPSAPKKDSDFAG